MKQMKIMADAGHVAWDMEAFGFLDEDREFDSIHPSLLRQSRLNNNYGLYKVTDGIYQVRGFDLSDISFVRGKTGWIIIDVLISAETARAALKLFREHIGGDLPITAVIYSHSHADQNAFVIEAFGRGLAIATGYYPWYGSPHHHQWTRSTQAVNSVLIDGKGQIPRKTPTNVSIGSFQ